VTMCSSVGPATIDCEVDAGATFFEVDEDATHCSGAGGETS
jgi:hypothetical protein